jgi:hypothetical protein
MSTTGTTFATTVYHTATNIANYISCMSPSPSLNPPKMLYAEEYEWAVQHSNHKDAIAFLDLPWGTEFFEAQKDNAKQIALRIQKRIRFEPETPF